MRNLRGGSQGQGLFGPKNIEVAEARRQHQREEHQEEEARAFHRANGYGTLNRQPIGSMIGK